MNAYYKPGTDLHYQDISHERERELFAAARAGDEAAKEFLIKNHLLYAAIQGRRWAHGKLPEDEVVSTANFALMKAFESFDHTRDSRFSSYLRPCIRGEIARLWTSKGNLTELPSNLPEESVDCPVEADEHREFLLKVLADSKGVLTDAQAEVIRLMFAEDGLDGAEIAELKGVTRARVHQIKTEALAKLKREMGRRMAEMGEV
jgi:RNA polymerase sigma factor (sigma-70 family)